MIEGSASLRGTGRRHKMDLVTRLLHIFPVKKQQSLREVKNEESRAIGLISDEGWSPPWLDEGNIRLVLFHDRDGHGKIPVFDTKQNTTKQVDSLSVSSPVNDDSISSNRSSNLTSSSSSRARAQSSDSKLLGEMMFGSMPLKLAGNSVKIHYIKSLQQLILTKIFTAQHRAMPTCRVGNFGQTCPVSVEQCYMDSSLGGASMSDCNGSLLRVPSVSPESDARSYSNSFNHSHRCPSPSASLPVSLGSSYNHDSSSPNQSWTQGMPVPAQGSLIPPSSLNSSLTRRFHRARTTSLENATHLYHRVLRPMDEGTTTVKKGRRFAIGLLFSLSDMKPSERRLFQDFFFSHFALISNHLEELRVKIEEALSGRRANLPERVTDAYNTFVSHFLTLYCTRRIKAPVWLSVVRSSSASTKRDICKKFLSEFTSLALEFDDKDSKFFLSTVLSSVLSLHLAWMFTVSKNSYATSRHDKLASRSLAVLPERHPYNPLWAQLGDLYGAVTDPLIVTRTIVTGTNVVLIHRLLYILTYFIRCSEIAPNSLIDLKNGCLEDSDKNYESRAESTVTVTDDVTCSTNSIHIQQRADLPFIKAHPFSFHLNSASNSLRSVSSGMDSVTDIPKTTSTVASSHQLFGECSSVNSNLSLKFQNDISETGVNKSKNNGFLHSTFTHHSAHTFTSLDDHPCVSQPKCTCSVDSSDSVASEPTTDSGQFSDPELFQKNKDCIVHNPQAHSCPTYEGPALCHDKLHQTIIQSNHHYKPHMVVVLPDEAQTLAPLAIEKTTHSESFPKLPVSQATNLSVYTYSPEHRERTSSLSASLTAPLPVSLSPGNYTLSTNHCVSSPSMVACLSSSPGVPRNKSWTGLPLLEGACSELRNDSPISRSVPDGCNNEVEECPMSLKIDEVNVEESLAPGSMYSLASSSLHSDYLTAKGMKYAKQFQDFTPIDISRCTVTPNPVKPSEWAAAEGCKCPPASTPSRSLPDASLSDFGHSLMAGFSEKYLNDFVLHGTSQPLSEFKDALITDLCSIVKNSIVDVPVQHAAAIVIDTDSLSCKTFVVSRSPRTPDGELLTGSLSSSNSVHELIQSVSLLWKMQMGPEFCLSHLEDRLMELNDRSQMLSSAILEKPESLELPVFLHRLHSTLKTHPTDQPFLQALASVHCSNCDTSISSALQTSFIRSLNSTLK